MSYCPKCRVEIRDQRPDCPLCGAALTDQLPEGPAPAYPEHLDRKPRKMSPQRWKKIRRVFMEILTLGVFLVIPLMFFNAYWEGSSYKSILIPVFSVLYGYIFLASWITGGRKPLIAGGISLAATLLFLWSLDALISGRPWFLALGVPVVLGVYGPFGFAGFMIGRAKRKGFNIPAYLLGATIILCFVIDAFVSLFAIGRMQLSWSIIVLMSLFPVMGYLIYIHIKVRNFDKWKRFFHY